MAAASETANITLKIGCAVSVGGRDYLEDFITIIKNFNEYITAGVNDNIPRSFFGVYDGHGGAIAAEFLSKRFHVELGSRKDIVTNPKGALIECWKTMDQKLLEELTQIRKSRGGADLMDGSTCTVALMVGNDIFIANCGDSSAYCFMPSQAPMLLTEVHGTETTSEVKRIIDAGGTLLEQVPKHHNFFKRLCCLCLGSPVVPKRRVNPGGLLVTRAFGDFHAKLPARGGRSGVVIHDHGEVATLSISDLRGAFLVLASDGVWDGLDAKVVQDIVRSGGSPASGASTATAQQIVPVNKSAVRTYKNTVGKLNGVLDESLVDVADSCVQAAIRSPYWTRAGAAADNTSCIILQFC